MNIKHYKLPFSVDLLVGEARTTRRTEDGQSIFHRKKPLKQKFAFTFNS